jgi:hypothetical protein
VKVVSLCFAEGISTLKARHMIAFSLAHLAFVKRTQKLHIIHIHCQNHNPIMSLRSLRMIYFAYMHSIIIYGIIFWGNSSYTIKSFRIPKR